MPVSTQPAKSQVHAVAGVHSAKFEHGPSNASHVAHCATLPGGGDGGGGGGDGDNGGNAGKQTRLQIGVCWPAGPVHPLNCQEHWLGGVQRAKFEHGPSYASHVAHSAGAPGGGEGGDGVTGARGGKFGNTGGGGEGEKGPSTHWRMQSGTSNPRLGLNRHPLNCQTQDCEAEHTAKLGESWQGPSSAQVPQAEGLPGGGDGGGGGGEGGRGGKLNTGGGGGLGGRNGLGFKQT